MSNKPMLLDLFCGAGGAAKGYQRAGFYVVGVDIRPQPHYCGDEFVQADALDFIAQHGREFDAIHASPPCQHASTIAKQNRVLRPGIYDHKNLIPQTRTALIETGLPYVIENVYGAHLLNPIVLCGSWFGLNVRRHRLFEANFAVFCTPCSHQWQTQRFRSLDKRRKTLSSVVGVHGHINFSGESKLREQAMDINWMTPEELTQAIPPAYTEFIGGYLVIALTGREMEQVKGQTA